jgi:tetratricopeptide (TPR) repeat protein
MSEDLEYIERYFLGNLSAGEKEIFEKRCEDDPDFAREVGLYITMRAGLKQTLIDEKKEEFRKLYHNSDSKPISVLRPSRSGVMWYAVAAAASFLIVLSWVLFLKSDSPKELAEGYVKETFGSLSATMSEGSDSLQLGIEAFNVKDFNKAERIFRALSKDKKYALEATKDLGITFLVRQQYDEALEQFDALTDNDSLYANPGPFYKAVTLMQRSGPGDEEAAKLILQDVVKKQLPGYKVASGWLGHW